MHRDGSNVGAPDVDRLCDEVERRLGSTVGNRRPRRRFLETVDGGHERRDGHPLGVLGLVEQRLRGVEESRGRDGVDEQDMHEVGWVNRLETALGTRDARVGDDDVELADALGLDLADGVGGVRRRGGFDLDEDEARARGRSDGPQVLSCGGVEVADTADDDVVGASEERCQESTAETAAGAGDEDVRGGRHCMLERNCQEWKQGKLDRDVLPASKSGDDCFIENAAYQTNVFLRYLYQYPVLP